MVDPVSGRTVVQQDMIQGLVVKDGHVGFVLEVAPDRARQSEPLRKICEAMALGVKGVKSVTAVLTAHEEHGHAHDHHHEEGMPGMRIPMPPHPSRPSIASRHRHPPACPASRPSSRWPAARAASANPPSRSTWR